MKTSISQCYVDSSHQISFTNFWYEKCWKQVLRNYVDSSHQISGYKLLMKNVINLMKTSISQCYVDSSHQISCYELLVWKMK